jgi:hypothetical protein
MVKKPPKPMIDHEAKRQERAAKVTTRIQWFDDQLTAGVEKTGRQRVAFAAQMLRDAIVINISKPVKKIKQSRRGKDGKRSSKTVVDPKSRSKPGEFPKADTTRLRKDIFWEKTKGGNGAIVGTTLDYGLILELYRDRSFILRTFNKLRPQLSKILGTDAGGKFSK